MYNWKKNWNNRFLVSIYWLTKIKLIFSITRKHCWSAISFAGILKWDYLKNKNNYISLIYWLNTVTVVDLLYRYINKIYNNVLYTPSLAIISPNQSISTSIRLHFNLQSDYTCLSLHDISTTRSSCASLHYTNRNYISNISDPITNDIFASINRHKRCARYREPSFTVQCYGIEKEIQCCYWNHIITDDIKLKPINIILINTVLIFINWWLCS